MPVWLSSSQRPAVDGLRRRDRPLRRQPRVALHARARVVGDRREVAGQRGAARRARRRRSRRSRRASVQSIIGPSTARRSARPCSVRAATTGACGSRSSGQPSIAVAAGERDVAAALAHDELRRGGVDRARAPQREHPVDARHRDLAQRDRDRADRADAVHAAAPGASMCGAIQRGSADSIATISSLPVACCGARAAARAAARR